MSAEGTRRQHDTSLLSLCLKVLEVEGKSADGVGPANLFELSGAALSGADQRPANAVRVVEGLEARFAACAMLADVDWVVYVAFDLLGAAFHDANDHALARSAERGVPVVSTGY